MPEDDTYLVCPNHGDEHPRMVETENDDGMVECLRCDHVFQNILKYPVVQLHKLGKAEPVYRNLLTGEEVDEDTARSLNSNS